MSSEDLESLNLVKLVKREYQNLGKSEEVLLPNLKKSKMELPVRVVILAGAVPYIKACYHIPGVLQRSLICNVKLMLKI